MAFQQTKEDNKINNAIANNKNDISSKLNLEIRTIIENTTEYKNYYLKNNKFNNCSQPYFPYGAIYPITLNNSNSSDDEKEEKYSCNNENIKTVNYIDFHQESNSLSHLSTTSEGEQGINTNYNNYFFLQSISGNKKNKTTKNKKSLNDLIKKGFNEISFYGIDTYFPKSFKMISFFPSLNITTNYLMIYIVTFY